MPSREGCTRPARALLAMVLKAGLVFTGGLAITAAALGACSSDEEKCDKARSSATTEWTSYIDELSAEDARLTKLLEDSKRALGSTVDARISEAAKRLADSRYPAGSDAWLRGQRAAYNDLCMKDTECGTLRHALAEAQAALVDIRERLELAQAARTALHEAIAQARSKALLAVIDASRPGLKRAQLASDEAFERCKGLPAQPTP